MIVEPENYEILTQKGEALYGLGKYAETIDVYDQAIKCYPNNEKIGYYGKYGIIKEKHLINWDDMKS